MQQQQKNNGQMKLGHLIGHGTQGMRAQNYPHPQQQFGISNPGGSGPHVRMGQNVQQHFTKEDVSDDEFGYTDEHIVMA